MKKHRAKILLVDDSAFDRAIIEKRLGKLNFEVTVASDAQSGLAQILITNFDIILMDLVMEDMGGLEAVCEIRKMYNSNELPVIILTASNDEQTLLEAFANGANDYLVKPINFQAMVARIDSLLAIKQASEEMHKALELAEKANIDKSRFLYKMTKEMKLPLNSILGMSNLLASNELEPDLKRYLDIIQNSGENLLSLVSDIMEISSLDGCEVELDEKDFNLNSIVIECFELTMNKIQKKNVDLIYFLDERVESWHFGDEEKLKKILIHLLMNAGKFTDEGEIFLHVSPSAVENRVIISISDTGRGISEEYLGNIFEHFVHDTSDISTRFGAYGLGLSLCKKNIELLGGDIIAESKEGVGTTFYLEIPFVRSKKIQVDEELPRLKKNVQGMKILIIDDNATTLNLLKDKLEGWGAIVTVINSAEKGLLKLLKASKLEEDYDIIFIDAVMPRMNGFDVVERINKTLSLSSEIVLMLNSVPDFEEEALCKSLGITFSMLKPIVDQNLLLTINNIISFSNLNNNMTTSSEGYEEKLINLLIVDDMQEVIDSMIFQLEDYPFRVFTTTRGSEAIKIIDEQNIEVVLIDYKMPEMNGLELIQKCQELDVKAKIIMTSCYLSKKEMDALVNSNDIHSIEKPFEVDELLDIIGDIEAVEFKKVA